ncbi:MAG: GWxTD domain-containing protein [Ignavibacteriales bacterium]|nr:GWxTD domain-containing protein [Ignavibacteriales bacterium]
MKKYFFALLLFLSISLFGQQSAPPLRLSYDIARFRGDAENLYVEVYYSFDVTALKYVQENGSHRSETVMSVMWRIPFSVTDTSMLANSRSYVDVFGFMLQPDVYRVYLVAQDVYLAANRDSLSFAVDLKPFPQTNIFLSDVELAGSIVQMERDTANRFYKNTFEVKPNPTKLFGQHQPVLFYYLEAYNLLKNKSEKYFTKAVVSNAVGKEVINHEKMKRRMNDSNVEVGMVKVNSLRTGVYTFSYSIIDSVDSSTVSAAKKFFVYNPSLPIDTLVSPLGSSVDASEYAAMSEEELDKEFEQSRYVALRDETAQYAKLKGVDAKRKAMFDFWTSRDEDKSTPINETKLEYFRRIALVNSQYKTGFREGWKTDRGRVYVIYGQPDEIERHANETDVKPYEVWYYNSIQGGVQFIFGDRTGFSDYILLHSTHRNELHDEQWRRQIQSN